MNKNILLTGASSGIGHAIGQMLLDKGASIVTIGRQQPVFSGEYSGNAEFLCCNLSEFSSLKATVNQSLKSQCLKSGGKVHGAVLCHGYGEFGGLEQFSQMAIEKLIDTNFTSYVLLSRLLLPVLKSNNAGDLIFIGSEAALKAGKNGAVYSATKFALRGFVQALRPECAASNVRVSIVNPGMVDTPFFDSLDFQPGESRDNSLRAEDVAQAICFMLSMPVGSVIDEINLSPQKTVIRNK